MNTLLQELRDATREIHDQVDRLVSVNPPSVSVSSYADYLARFHDGLSESWAMLNWSALRELGLPDAEARKRRYASLVHDLSSLGCDADDFADEMNAGPATSVGCLYVLEGSVHGGQILLSALRKNAPHVADESVRFLTGFGSENSTLWRSFMSWLQSLDANPEFVADARKAAIRTFECFLVSLDLQRWQNPKQN